MNLREVFWKSKEIIPGINYIRQIEENKFLALSNNETENTGYILLATQDEIKIINEAS